MTIKVKRRHTAKPKVCQLKERSGDAYTTKCGRTERSKTGMPSSISSWHSAVTCPECR